MTKWDSFQVHKDDSTYANQCDIPHQQKIIEKCITISVDAGKAVDKIQHSFMIKLLPK